MKQLTKTSFIALLAAATTLHGCGSDNEPVDSPASPAPDTAQTAAEPAPQIQDMGGASPGKPTAPIMMRYEIVGNPVVGTPVQINIDVSSSQGPVTVTYSVPDASALTFVEGQVRKLAIEDPAVRQPRQMSVIPQREGRLYVNVSAEVETPGGTKIRSMSIPIKVGSAPEAPTINGELKEGPDGETVISMPAEEAPPQL